MKLTFEGESLTEVLNEIEQFIKGVAGKAAVVEAKEEEIKIPKKKKVTRKSTDKNAKGSKERSVDTRRDDPAGKEECAKALKLVNVKVNIMAAKKVLEDFGAKKLSDLRSDQYKGFLNKCDEIIAGV